MVRSLDHYYMNNVNMIMSDLEASPSKFDAAPHINKASLKLSVALESNNSWTRTLDFDSSLRNGEGLYILRFLVSESRIDNDTHSLTYLFIKYIFVHRIVFILDTSNAQYARRLKLPDFDRPTKLYFLATGTGCATVEVKYDILI